MVKKTIFSLTLSLLLFASNVNAMDDAASSSGGRMPNLGGIPSLGLGSSSAARIPNLAPTLDDSDDDDGLEAERRAGRDSKERKDQRDDRADELHEASSSSRSRDVDAHERGLDALYRKLGKSLLCPDVDPRDMLHANNMLYGKYAGYVKTGFRQLDAATLDPDFFAFLRTNGRALEYVCDAYTMRIFLGFLAPLNTQSLLLPHAMAPVRFQTVVPDGGRVLLASMARTKHGKLVIDVDGGLKLLRGAIMPAFGPMMGSYPMMGAPMMGGGGMPVDPLDGVLKQLRKIATPDSRQLYDDQEVLSEVVSQWFNVTRRLYMNMNLVYGNKKAQE